MNQLSNRELKRQNVRIRPRTTSRTNSTTKFISRPSIELAARIRQLMEQTIEFVDDPSFSHSGAETRIEGLRPASLDQSPPPAKREPGIAFVSELVQSPILSCDEERYLFLRLNFVKWRAERNRRRLDLSSPNETLADRIQLDLDEALRVRNHIVRANLRLIVALARKLTNSLDQMSDLVGEGMSPLIRSVELFDVGLGYRFSTYATWAVRNQMLRWIKRGRMFPDCPMREDTPSLENLPDRRPREEPLESVPLIRSETVIRLLESLDERERIVVAARFGLDGNASGQSLAEIALQVGLSKERVRQIVLSSLSKLREGITYEEFEAIS